MSATVEELDKLFKQFGSIKRDGIQVRSNKVWSRFFYSSHILVSCLVSSCWPHLYYSNREHALDLLNLNLLFPCKVQLRYKHCVLSYFFFLFCEAAGGMCCACNGWSPCLNASISICKSYRTVSNIKLVCQASPIEFGNRLLSIEERRGKLKYLSSWIVCFHSSLLTTQD